MLIDDLFDNPQRTFTARVPAAGGKTFKAELQEISDGEVTSTRKLACIVIP